jgi:hypothetical protein
MLFGQYRGRALTELPDDYLEWLLGLDDLREPLRTRVGAEASRRAEARDPEPERPLTGPADGDLAAALIEAGRRALAVKFHPDKGGDTRTMQSVNSVADQLLARFPRRRRAA